MRSHFIPQKPSTSHPKSRTPLILLELEDNSELPDFVWFPETCDYFKQLHVKRSANTGFAFICLNLSQHKALGELGKKRAQCYPWYLRVPFFLFSAESQRELSPLPTLSGCTPWPCAKQQIWLITPTPEAKGVLLIITLDVWGLLFLLPKLTQLKTTVSGFPLYLLLQLLKKPSCHFFKHPHSSGHRTVRLEQAHCII